jgi:hypothetical protein
MPNYDRNNTAALWLSQDDRSYLSGKAEIKGQHFKLYADRHDVPGLFTLRFYGKAGKLTGKIDTSADGVYFGVVNDADGDILCEIEGKRVQQKDGAHRMDLKFTFPRDEAEPEGF